jgi:phospholipase/carboxylesterase
VSPETLLRRLGGLDTLVVPGSADGLVIAMFHGFGADAHDLLPLSGVVHGPPGTSWLFPNAPIQVPLAPQVVGRAWFPIDLVELQAAMLAGRHRDLSHQRPPALVKAREMAQQMLADFHAPMARTVLAGFSQGAMLATAMALHADEAPAGLAILSGTLLDQQTWTELAPRRKGMAKFQSHGVRDPLLAVDAARRLHDLLSRAGIEGPMVEFEGDHEIPMAVLAHFGSWLRELPRSRPTLH